MGVAGARTIWDAGGDRWGSDRKENGVQSGTAADDFLYRRSLHSR